VSSLKTLKDPNLAVQTGTLRDLFNASRDSKSQTILNALSLPLGDVSAEAPPKFRSGTLTSSPKQFNLSPIFRYLASHEAAWQLCRGRPGFVRLPPFSDQLIWGTAASKHAASWPHIDDEGFATVCTPQVGSKYWVLGRQRRQVSTATPVDNAFGDMGSVNAFGLKFAENDSVDKEDDRVWQPGSSNTEIFDYEGVLLTPGSVL
jgi:hypothetical protein